MAQKLNIGDVLRNHSHYKSLLLRTYKYLQAENERNLDLMKQIKPMLEKSDVQQVNGIKELEDKIKEIRED